MLTPFLTSFSSCRTVSSKGSIFLSLYYNFFSGRPLRFSLMIYFKHISIMNTKNAIVEVGNFFELNLFRNEPCDLT